MQNEAGREEIGKVARIYKVAPGGNLESMESADLEAGEELAMFFSDEGIVVIIGRVARIEGDL